MFKNFTTSAFIGLYLAGCATDPDYQNPYDLGLCLDDRNWERLVEPPSDNQLLQKLVTQYAKKETPITEGEKTYDVWFEGETQELLLCRIVHKSCFRDMWEFQKSDNAYNIANIDGIVCT